MRQIDAVAIDRHWRGIVWHIISMAGWLHAATVLFALAKGIGFVHLSWVAVFMPSLLYGALVLLGIGSCTVLILADRISYKITPVSRP